MSKKNSVPPGAEGVEDREEKKRRNDAADERTTVSRRSFIKSTGIASVAVSAGVLLGDEVAKAAGRAQGEGKWLGPGPVDVTLKINGKERKLNIEPRVTLLDAMRKRDARKARSFMEKHIQKGGERLIETLRDRGLWQTED